MLFYYSVIRFWPAVNSVLAIWKGERIKEKCPQIRFITMNIRHSSYEYCFFINKAFSAFYRKDYMTLT